MAFNVSFESHHPTSIDIRHILLHRILIPPPMTPPRLSFLLLPLEEQEDEDEAEQEETEKEKEEHDY